MLQLHGVTFKKRAPKAIKEIKAFATKSMVQEPYPKVEKAREKGRDRGTRQEIC